MVAICVCVCVCVRERESEREREREIVKVFKVREIIPMSDEQNEMQKVQGQAQGHRTRH